MSIIDFFIKHFNFTENIDNLFNLVSITFWIMTKSIAILIAALLPCLICFLIYILIYCIISKFIDIG